MTATSPKPMLVRRASGTRAAKRAGLHVLGAVVALTACIGQAAAQQAVFSPLDDARKLLGTRDAFVQHMSPFDRAARLETDRAVPESEYLRFAAQAALAWNAAEQARLEPLFRDATAAAQRLGLPVPARVRFIKTTGREEGGAAYTRGDAIVLPEGLLKAPAPVLSQVVAHELFHVASRAQPQLARSLYAAAGFAYCGDIALPPAFAARRITNPDAPKTDYCIEVQVGGANIWVMPVLVASTPAYDSARGGRFFEYLQFGFLRVTRPADGRAPWRLHDPRATALMGLDGMRGFFEKVGRNGEQYFHPEEVLAENFALLVAGKRNVPSPEVQARVEAALAKSAASAGRP